MPATQYNNALSAEVDHRAPEKTQSVMVKEGDSSLVQWRHYHPSASSGKVSVVGGWPGTWVDREIFTERRTMLREVIESVKICLLFFEQRLRNVAMTPKRCFGLWMPYCIANHATPSLPSYSDLNGLCNQFSHFFHTENKIHPMHQLWGSLWHQLPQQRQMRWESSSPRTLANPAPFTHFQHDWWKKDLTRYFLSSPSSTAFVLVNWEATVNHSIIEEGNTRLGGTQTLPPSIELVPYSIHQS